MRLSSDPTDPGYCEAAIGHVSIFLDGRYLRDCITADEEAGRVLVMTRDQNGRLVLNRERTAVCRHERYGEVRIELHEPRAETIRRAVS